MILSYGGYFIEHHRFCVTGNAMRLSRMKPVDLFA